MMNDNKAQQTESIWQTTKLYHKKQSLYTSIATTFKCEQQIQNDVIRESSFRFVPCIGRGVCKGSGQMQEREREST